MKVGDLVKYVTGCTAIILCVYEASGTAKAINDNGNMCWLVTSDCEVISESR
jgi:hypothetical protein